MTSSIREARRDEAPPVVRAAFDRLAEQRLKKAMELAPKSMAVHARLFHRDDRGVPLRPARHHQEWIRILSNRDKYRWVVIVAPPGYAKSTWCSMVYPSWRIGVEGGKVRIGIISNTATQAQGFASAVRTAVMNGRFGQTYEGVVPDETRGWAREQFWVKSAVDSANPTVMAAGMGGPITGKRFDEIILDDPTSYADARSRTIMDAQKTFVQNTVLTRFPAGFGPPDGKGRMVVVLTRWGENDLVPLFEERGFTVIRMPALGYWDRVEDPTTGEITYGNEPLWPERHPLRALLEEREANPINFELVYQGNARAMSGGLFKMEQFRYGSPPYDERHRGPLEHQITAAMEAVVQFVDTASGKDRERGDYFAMATVGIRKGGREVWVLDIDRDRYSAPEQEERVIANIEKWNPERIYIEDVNEGVALRTRLQQYGKWAIIPWSPHSRDKETRAVPLAGAYKNGWVIHSAVELNGRWISPKWVQRYEGELLAFPRGEHDDQVDAVGAAYENIQAAGPRIRVLGG